jgi:hypothetical protein
MANLQPRNLKQIASTDSLLGPCLTDIVDAHNNIAQQTNASPVGITPSPDKHADLKVSGGNGFFSVQITDNSPSFRGKENFLEVSEDRAFTTPHVIHLGASQSWYGNLGAKTLHFRSYSQYPTSPPGSPIYEYGVNGASGSAPAIQGNGSAAGWGTQPYTTDKVPTR